ncbi:TATA-box-binding protein [Vulcanisaeta souniana]|uniref:TATA-box-binding protein n=1 Tax=Vulcanisaeta souniana JCM 11219 TaxID=1293586 RepID=A0A830EBB9_9CREN|nr:TATA-box-binding protein [Vulcanisaeta souniana]BDR92134.1 transcription factor [Vulcanisaeta souniana JCM 11219]GGI67676.1 transcription factor [Vulcanisaeta souniana JCM 11219]
MPNPTYRIENIVATVNLGVDLDLDKLAERLPAAEYNPEQFPGLILRLQRPKISALIFRTGKMVCTGAKSENELKRAVKELVRLLNEHGADVPITPEIQVQNIVASGNLHAEVDIEKSALMLENSMYEPEQFPGLIYRMDDPKVVLLIFSSGKIVCTGAKKEMQVKDAVFKIHDVLKDIGALYEEVSKEEEEF